MDPLFLKKLLENQNLQNNPNQDLNQNPNLKFIQTLPHKEPAQKFPSDFSNLMPEAKLGNMVSGQPVYNSPSPEQFIPPTRRPRPPMRRPEPPMKIGPVRPIKGGPVLPPKFGGIKKLVGQ